MKTASYARRIGNTFPVTLYVRAAGISGQLSDHQVSVSLINETKGRRASVPCITSGQEVKFSFTAALQEALGGTGSYTPVLILDAGDDNLAAADWHKSIEIVSHSDQEFTRRNASMDVGPVMLTGDLSLIANGLSAYEMWLADGHQGSVHDYIVDMKRPAIDAAQSAGETMDAIQIRANADHSRAETDHNTADGDHMQAVSDHDLAETDHIRAELDHSTATEDHETSIETARVASEAVEVASNAVRSATEAVEAAGNAVRSATKAAEGANEAVRAANEAVEDANEATQAANDASDTAKEAAREADTARENIRDELAKKANKPATATEGNLAMFDANLNPVDAGYSARRIHRDLGYRAAESAIALTVGETGKYIKRATQSAVAAEGYNISAPFDVEAGAELLIKTGYDPSDQAHAPLDLCVIAIFEEHERTHIVQKKDSNGNPLYYGLMSEGGTDGTETTTVTDYPVYVTEEYVERRYIPFGSDNVDMVPDSGYYLAHIPQSCKCAISYVPGVTDMNVVVVRHSALVNIIAQLLNPGQQHAIAESIVSLAERIDAIEKRIQQPGNIKVGTLDVVSIKRYLYPDIIIQRGVPSASTRPDNIDDNLPWWGIPAYVGQMLINTANKKVYVACGNNAISDWVLLN